MLILRLGLIYRKVGTMFKVVIGRFMLEYDRDYGIDRRSGWCFAWDGSYRVQFARTAVGALWGSWWPYR